MGHKHSKTQSLTDEPQQNQFKLFEYKCSCCSSKRPIQYFYRNNTFLSQTPRVICGECNTPNNAVEPFKTVEYGCPSCQGWQKARLPARAMPLSMYNVSVVTCPCGFRGEVYVGRLMDVVCSHCWSKKRELRDVWAEDGDVIDAHCETCQETQRCFARAPRRRRDHQADADMEFTCENCFRTRSCHSEELLRNRGVATCSLCSWVGYPEVRYIGAHAGDRPLPKKDKARSSHEKFGRHESKPNSRQGVMAATASTAASSMRPLGSTSSSSGVDRGGAGGGRADAHDAFGIVPGAVPWRPTVD